jgi:hypothetical protein
VSLLLSEGHPFAAHYSLAKVGVEADIVRRRNNNRIVTESTLMQALLGAVMGGKGGAKQYTDMIKDLNRG